MTGHSTPTFSVFGYPPTPHWDDYVPDFAEGFHDRLCCQLSLLQSKPLSSIDTASDAVAVGFPATPWWDERDGWPELEDEVIPFYDVDVSALYHAFPSEHDPACNMGLRKSALEASTHVTVTERCLFEYLEDPISSDSSPANTCSSSASTAGTFTLQRSDVDAMVREKLQEPHGLMACLEQPHLAASVIHCASQASAFVQRAMDEMTDLDVQRFMADPNAAHTLKTIIQAHGVAPQRFMSVSLKVIGGLDEKSSRTMCMGAQVMLQSVLAVLPNCHENLEAIESVVRTWTPEHLRGWRRRCETRALASLCSKLVLSLEMLGVEMDLDLLAMAKVCQAFSLACPIFSHQAELEAFLWLMHKEAHDSTQHRFLHTEAQFAINMIYATEGRDLAGRLSPPAVVAVREGPRRAR